MEEDLGQEGDKERQKAKGKRQKAKIRDKIKEIREHSRALCHLQAGINSARALH